MGCKVKFTQGQNMKALLGFTGIALPLLQPRRCRWEDTIKIALKGVGWRGMDWVDLAQDRDRQLQGISC